MPEVRWSAARELGVAVLLGLGLAVLTACGSPDESVHAAGPRTHVSASDPTDEPTDRATRVVTPRVPSPVKAGANRALATAETSREIKAFPVPPGSRSIAASPQHARYLRKLHYFNLPVDQSLTRTRFWLVRQSNARVVAWYVHHFPADRGTASYHRGGRLAPKAGVWWQPTLRSTAFSPPTKVISYVRLGPHLTAIRADVTLAARADRTARTLVPTTVTSLLIVKQIIGGADTGPTTVTTSDQGGIFRVIDAFNDIPGDYASSESFGCTSPDGVRNRYAVTFRWPDHTLTVTTGDPLCGAGRMLTLDGHRLPEALANGYGLNAALHRAFTPP